MRLRLKSLIEISLAIWLVFGEQVRSENDVDNNEMEEIRSGAICDTEECHQVAEALIHSVNQSVDPCVDFYEYACGNWYANNPLPNNVPELFWETMYQFNLIALTRLREQLETEPSEEEISPVRQMKKMYKTCMDESGGLEPIMEIFRKTNGWPMIMNIDAWNRSARTWQEIDSFYDELGYSSFWNFEINDEKLSIIPPLLIVNLLSTSQMRTYGLVIKKLAGLFIKANNLTIPEKQLDQDINDLISFEKALAQLMIGKKFSASYPDVNSFVEDWRPNTVANSTRGKIDWEETMKRLLNFANRTEVDSTPVELSNILYFDRLEFLLESTDERTIVNFIHWNLLLSVMPYSTGEMANVLHPLLWIIDRTGTLNSRCIYQMDPATIHLFAREFYGISVNEKLHTMITNIKKSLEIRTEESNWLSIKAKEAITEKLHRMKYRIGYPEWYDHETDLISYYEGMTIGDSYFENVFSLEKTYWKRTMESWGRPTKYEISENQQLLVNAVYASLDNALKVPVVFLQPPLFQGNLPKYVEYGTLGSVIGHEMGHAIGPTGVLYGLDQNKPLIDHNMRRILLERAQCFVDMGHKRSTKMNPSELDENIADWYGKQATFDSYKEMRDKEYPNGELKLPKFEAFTDEQMFFISYGQVHCAARNKVAIGRTHSPYRLRVMLSLSNTAAFAEAFHCSKNTPMNPEKKCNIWTKPVIAS